MSTRPPRIAIVGAGFGGLCAAIQLKKHGYDDLVLLEKSSSFGGTWRDNVYPGAACDSPSFQYCLSFEQKYDWSRKWARQPEILEYIQGTAARHGLDRVTRFGAALTSARFHGGRWRIEASDGFRGEFDALVCSVGQLHRPLRPALPGLDAFEGQVIHTAEWPRGLDLRGKRVALVGTGATAIQVAPELARDASHLAVFQRSPSWVMPKDDREYSRLEHLLLERLPLAGRAYRALLWLDHEIRFPAIRGSALFQRVATHIATRHLEAQVHDPALRRALTPRYPITGKRALISDDFYPCFARPNVELIPEAAARVEGRTLVSEGGTRRELDVIVLATGFQASAFLPGISIEGLGGLHLSDAWKDGAEAYLGIRVADFPSLFLLYGPNTNLGHNSILFMLECQVHYLLETLRFMRDNRIAWTNLRPEVQREHVARLQRKLARTTWAAAGASWYKNEAGRITNNWPESTLSYWKKTRRFEPSFYRLAPDHGG